MKYPDEYQLDGRAAYAAMVDFIWLYSQQSGSLDLGNLIGDSFLINDGGPSDPALMDLWRESVERIASGQATRGKWDPA